MEFKISFEITQGPGGKYGADLVVRDAEGVRIGGAPVVDHMCQNPWEPLDIVLGSFRGSVPDRTPAFKVDELGLRSYLQTHRQ